MKALGGRARDLAERSRRPDPVGSVIVDLTFDQVHALDQLMRRGQKVSVEQTWHTKGGLHTYVEHDGVERHLSAAGRLSPPLLERDRP